MISRQAPSKAKYCKWSISAPFFALPAEPGHSIESVPQAPLPGVRGAGAGVALDQLILFEDLAQPGFLGWAEVTVDQLCVGADEPLPNPVHNAT